MSKSHIQAFALAQVESLNNMTVKERLRFTIAGCKDGKLYDNVGTDYGTYDVEVPDAEWITPADLELARVTTVKVQKIQNLMKDFFNEHGKPVATNTTTNDSDNESDDTPDDSSDVEVSEETQAEPEAVQPTEDMDLDIAEIEKKISKGKFKKAQKLINAIEDKKVAKKLQKKLDKAQ